MTRVLPTENLLSDEMPKKKVRNYSFQHSKRLPVDKMTEVNGIKIPSMPGSCYHAIIAALAEYKDKFCIWDKIVDLTQRNMRMYGGQKAWDKFMAKSNVKSYQQRIKDNAHTLTRTGRDCYGYRLHEQGMCIYYFKDGAMLLTGGEIQETDDTYNVIFSDGHKLQTRYRGTTMTYKEYKRFLEKRFIDITGRIMNPNGIKQMRALGDTIEMPVDEVVHVCVVLNDTFDQNTAVRLERVGLEVEQGLGNELIGTAPSSKLNAIRQDSDVKEVEVSGE
jgi:hypothetical protein